MIGFKVIFEFDNLKTETLTYYVNASDMIEAEKLAFEKLGENGKKHKTGVEITPIVLDLTLGRPDKIYDSFKDQMADDPKIIELAMMYLRGDQKIKDEIKRLLDKMFNPLGKDYQDQAMSTLKMVASLGAIHDVEKYGKTPYLVDWLEEMKK